MEISLMIEGQDGVNWPRWQSLARTVEASGFTGLYRSDHFTNPDGPLLDALELWTSQTWLASHTERIVFGPVVSPVSFRDPVITAWTAIAIDDLSGGRFRLGLGAGWQEREHAMFGYDLLDTEQRFVRFTEALEVIAGLFRSTTPFTFEGEYYAVKDAVLMPRPVRAGGPTITIGGNGPKRTLPLAARFADDWNAVYTTPERFAELNRELNAMLADRDRPQTSVRRSLMHRAVFGRTQAEAEAKIPDPEARARLIERGGVVGTGDAIRAWIDEFAAVGVQEIMIQWVDGLDDLDGIRALGDAVIR